MSVDDYFIRPEILAYVKRLDVRVVAQAGLDTFLISSRDPFDSLEYEDSYICTPLGIVPGVVDTFDVLYGDDRTIQWLPVSHHRPAEAMSKFFVLWLAQHLDAMQDFWEVLYESMIDDDDDFLFSG